MTRRRRWGSLAIFLTLLSTAHADAAATPLAVLEPLHADVVEYLDPLNEIRLSDLYPKSRDAISDFESSGAEANQVDLILRRIQPLDLHDYLLACNDFGHTNPSKFAETITAPQNSHSYVFKMAAIKILLSNVRKGARIDISRIYRSITQEQPSSALAFVLKAEDALVCSEDGLPIARTCYRESVSKYPNIPCLRNREAYLYESAGGMFWGTGPRKSSFTQVVTPRNLRTAVEIRTDLRKRFPRYEPNYYYLAGDYRNMKQKGEERSVLKDYFKRFGSSGSFYGKCKAMSGEVG